MNQKSNSYGSDYLYSEDLLIGREYKTVEAEIEQVIPPDTLKSADGRRIDKWTLRFKGKQKALPLCSTNKTIVHNITGDPPGEAWIGWKVKLQVRIVDAFGDKVTAIRVMPPAGCMVRKSVLKRLGEKAVWQPPTNTVAK